MQKRPYVRHRLAHAQWLVQLQEKLQNRHCRRKNRHLPKPATVGTPISQPCTRGTSPANAHLAVMQAAPVPAAATATAPPSALITSATGPSIRLALVDHDTSPCARAPV